jgi:hypothetical protein
MSGPGISPFSGKGRDPAIQWRDSADPQWELSSSCRKRAGLNKGARLVGGRRCSSIRWRWLPNRSVALRNRTVAVGLVAAGLGVMGLVPVAVELAAWNEPYQRNGSPQ